MEWESDSPSQSHTYPGQGPRFPGRCNGWQLEFRDVEQSQGEGCCWLWRDRWRGFEEGNCGGKCLWRKAKQPWKQGNTAESRVAGGAITIASLSPQPASGSWTIERVAHQMPDALNYRLGPQPGGPFRCLMCLNYRVGPQQGELSMCLACRTTEKDLRPGSHVSAWISGRSYWEILSKQASWLPATRGLKNTDRP